MAPNRQRAGELATRLAAFDALAMQNRTAGRVQRTRQPRGVAGGQPDGSAGDDRADPASPSHAQPPSPGWPPSDSPCDREPGQRHGEPARGAGDRLDVHARRGSHPDSRQRQSQGCGYPDPSPAEQGLPVPLRSESTTPTNFTRGGQKNGPGQSVMAPLQALTVVFAPGMSELDSDDQKIRNATFCG